MISTPCQIIHEYVGSHINKPVKKSTCKNCDTQFDGSYCPNCAQSINANHRLTFKSISFDFVDAIFNLDKGILYTSWNLLRRPGFVAQSFLDGKRKRFTNPIKLFIIATAFQALFVYFFMDQEKGIPYTDFSFLSSEMNQSMHLWNQILAVDYPIFIGIVHVLIWPLPLYFLFKSLNYNYAELVTVMMYFYSTVVILIMLFTVIHNPITKTNLSMELVIGVATTYMLYALISFYNHVTMVKRFTLIVFAFLILSTFRVFILPLSLSWFFPLN